MRPKLPRHKQRDMSVRCRHKETGWRFDQKKEDWSARMQWRNERVKLVHAANAPKTEKQAKARMMEMIYLRTSLS